ncbi:MAG: hypothetical protein QXQ41_05205, partial [Candidatus Bathyarchaeia archaeon]
MPKLYIIGLLLIVGLILVYAFQGYYPEFIFIFSNATLPFISGAALAVSLVTLGKYWRKGSEPFSLVWFGFACGLFLWFLGETTWAVYTLILGIDVPYPSLADFFWIMGYIPFFIALLMYVRIFSHALSWRNMLIIMVATLIVTVFVYIAMLNPIVHLEKDVITSAVDFAYPTLDILLFFIATLGLMIFWKGKLGRSWLLICSATLVDVIA